MTNTEANYIEKLRSSGLRPTKQRLKICEILFSREKTFHFSISDLTKILEDQHNEKISLATVYNTVHAFQKKGYLKEINIGNDISYFDTNTSSHHHFYDEQTKELIDINSQEVEIKKTPMPPSGKKIEDIEVTFKITKII
jgi:Fur family iron response transcriptional regulator|tara:strand:+ start:769 stop:1188 length:420 start_codon:yes stop_codon:yes gene_type:complete